MGILAIPASTHVICIYTAFLARSLKFSSVISYVNIIGLLHKEFCLANPLSDNWAFNSLHNSIKRVKGSSIKQKLSITIDILRGIFKLLNMHISCDASFWAICLVAFFGFFRKSHLLTTSAYRFNPNLQFTRDNFSFYSWGVLVQVKWKLSSLGTELFPFPFLSFTDHPYVPLLPYLEHSLLLGLPLPVLRLLPIFTQPCVPSRFSPAGLSCVSLGYALALVGTHLQNMQDVLFIARGVCLPCLSVGGSY